MWLKRAIVHNFRSACENTVECRVTFERRITCLIGPSEAGKTNILEALAAFELGEFNFEDVPRSQISPTITDPPYDLPMVSTVFILESDDLENAPETNQLQPGDEITFTRNYRGGVYLSELAPLVSRDKIEVASDIRSAASEYLSATRSLIGAYNRQRASMAKPPVTTTNRLSRRLSSFVSLLNDTRASAQDTWPNDIDFAFQANRARFERLSNTVIERIPRQTFERAQTVMRDMKALIDEMNQEPQTAPDLEWLHQIRPTFVHIPSTPQDWLQGKYVLADLTPKSTRRGDPSVQSALRLLDLANLDLQAVQNVRRDFRPDLLKEASDTATRKLASAWTQHPIAIRFELDPEPGTGNLDLIIYLETDDHRGLPTQRSLGFRWFLEFYLLYAADQSGPNNRIWLMDEPGIHLHLQGQRDLLELFRSALTTGRQFVYTTHLPTMVDVSSLDGVRGIAKDHGDRHGTYVTSDGDDDDHQIIVFEVLDTALGVSNLGAYGAGSTLVVEGITDWLYLVAMANVNRNNALLCHAIASGIIVIRPALGTGRIVNKVIPPLLVPGTTVGVLLDDDVAGRKTYNDIMEAYLVPNPPLTKILKISDPEYPDGWMSSGKTSEIEDLFGKDFFTAFVNKVLGRTDFTIRGTEQTSMAGKLVKEWMEVRNLFPKAEKVTIAKGLRDMVSEDSIVIPSPVMDRFTTLFSEIESALKVGR